MLPQLGVVSTVSLEGWSWANRNSRSTPGLLLRDDDPGLAGERMRAAQAVDLPRIRGAHGGQEDGVAGGRILRQIIGAEERPLGCSSPHVPARNGELAAGPSWARRQCGRGEWVKGHVVLLEACGQCAATATGGVPWVWKVSMVFMPHAWPLARSASVHSTVFQSGARIIRAPELQNSIRFPPGS
jgi:hypothetical protein